MVNPPWTDPVAKVQPPLVDDSGCSGVANIGNNPTTGEVETRLEVWLFDFDEDLYGQVIETSLVAFLRRQPGVEDAAWDKCIGKLDIWPGHSNIGLRWRVGEVVHERCWTVQEGMPGTVNFFGWRPKVRKARQHLKYKRASTCPGFVEQQRNYCAERGR
jgi:hypothetical protein